MRQVELADDDLNIHAEVVFVAENLDYAATRVLGRRRPIGNLNVHHQAFEIVPLTAARLFPEDAVGIRMRRAVRLGLLRQRGSRLAMEGGPSFGFRSTLAGWPLHPARNDDLSGDLLVDRRHVVLVRSVMKGAHDGGVTTCQHAQDAPLGTAVVTHPSTRKTGARWGPRSIALASQFHQHLVDVAAERAALAGVGDDEAVAVAVHGQASRDQVLMSCRMFRQGVAVASGLDQPRAFHQRLQPFGELPPLVAPQAHLADELLEPRRAVGLAFDVA